MKNNFNLTGEIKRSYKTKASGAYVSTAAALMMIVYAVASSGLDKSIFNSSIVIFAIVGILLFAALSAFTFTSKLGATMLMLFSFLSFCAFVKADGFIDYFSTQFFDGFSLAKIFGLGAPMVIFFVGLILSFILASVGMYLPQNKKKTEENTLLSGGDCFSDEKGGINR